MNVFIWFSEHMILGGVIYTKTLYMLYTKTTYNKIKWCYEKV